jgi:hypothetical protein
MTVDPIHPTHPNPELLAEHAEGLLEADVAATVAAHLAECRSCQAVRADLVALRAVLAADQPGPMPLEVAARIEAALAEGERRDEALQLSAELSAIRTEDGVLAGQRVSDDGQRTSLGDLLKRRRQQYRWYRRIAVAAAGLVVVAGASVLGVQLARDGDGMTAAEGGAVTGLAEDSGQGSTGAQEGAPPQMAPQAPRYAGSVPRTYTREGFAEQVASLLRSTGRADAQRQGAGATGDRATPGAGPEAGREAPPTTDPAANCAARLTAQVGQQARGQTRPRAGPPAGPQAGPQASPGAGQDPSPLAVDVASWEGQPALVVVLPEPGKPKAVHAYVIPRDCPGDPATIPVLHQAVLPRP